jgi:ABC-type branched-subunit amino acid transport system ATPase component
MTVLENMLLAAEHQIGEDPFSALFMRSRVQRSENANLARAMELLDMLQLTQLKNDYAGDLSGGQKKLLSLGRVFMLKPDMILLDEPTAGVNPTLRVQLMEAIKRLQEMEKSTFFIIEHSMKVISSICDKVYVLNFGQKIAEGTPKEIQQNGQVLDAYLGGA